MQLYYKAIAINLVARLKEKSVLTLKKMVES